MRTDASLPVQRRPGAIRAVRWMSVAAFGVSLFAILAVALIYAGPSVSWDTSISAALQATRTPFLDAIMITATYLCSWQVVVSGGALATIYLLIQRLWFAAGTVLVSLAGNVLIVGGIKNVLSRASPDQTHALLPASGSTFPSGHTFSAFAFYGLIGLIYVGQGERARRPRLVATLIVTLIVVVGLSRVYVGAHWPSDVLGSTFLGSGWLALLGLVLATARERTRRSSVQTSDVAASRWAVIMLLVWVFFVVAYAFFNSPATPSPAIA